MKRLSVLALLACFAFIGCGGEEAPPPEAAPPPPPEPTVDEIKQAFQQPLNSVVEIIKTGQAVPPEMLGQVNQELQKADTKYMGKKNLNQAKSEVGDGVDAALKQVQMVARQQPDNLVFWSTVITAADLLAFFEPNNPSIGPAKEEAVKELTRPRLSKPSFATDKTNNVTTVFLSVTFPAENRTEDYRVREGDDFADGRYRLLEIVGRNQGVRILDTQDGKEMEIMLRERE